MRVVLDTNVLVSAVIMPQGKPAQILRRLLTDLRHELLCSEYVLSELVTVLAHPHIQRKYQNLVTSDLQARFITNLRGAAELIEATSPVTAASDPADNLVLACALDGQPGSNRVASAAARRGPCVT